MKNDLATDIMKDIYIFKKSYNLRNNSTLKRTYIRLVYLGTEAISFPARKIWELVPNTIKNATSLKLFKKLSFGQQMNVLVGFVKYA